MKRCKNSTLRLSIRFFAVAVVAAPAFLASAGTARGQTADLLIEQIVEVESVTCGDQLTITQRVTNNGPNTAASVSVVNTLPECSPFVGFVTLSQGSAIQSMGVITTNFGTLNPDASATLVFILLVTPDCTPVYENVMNVTSATDDPNTDNNEAVLSLRVGCGDLTVEKTGLTEAACSGTIVYQLIARQTGPGAAGDVVVTDQLPSCLTNVICTTPQGSCTVDDNNLLTAELGTIDEDDSVAIAVVATVTDDCAPSISNSATISTPAPEPDTSNNTSNTFETTIVCKTGACCLADAPCEELTIAGCAAAGGTFEGLDTTCADSDSDGDGRCDAFDGCPDDANKIAPGACGCGEADTDTDEDGVPDCEDNCPDVANADQADADDDGIGDACEENGACGLVCGPGTMPLLPLMVIGWWSMKRRRR